jgi:hypothetical protein
MTGRTGRTLSGELALDAYGEAMLSWSAGMSPTERQSMPLASQSLLVSLAVCRALGNACRIIVVKVLLEPHIDCVL